MDAIKTNLEAKLKELLYKINSFEIKICSGATKEFIKLLKGEIGSKLLHLYVRTSPKCSELLDAWKLQRGRAGMRYLFSLVSAILSHPDGNYSVNDMERISTSHVLDMLARSLIEECLGDINSELGSQVVKHQNAALLLMSSIVRRGSGLASEVAKNFDFKLRAFSKLAQYRRKPNQKRSKHSARKLFVGFAMSFLEVGKPGLLRWVLQQREMYSGVLRGLGNDDEETIIYVLSTLRDKVLVDESLVPPSLRSVLFGSVTLEQLANICERENGGSAADLAYQVLVMVCTDPCNGLIPDLKRHPNPLRGNPKRIMGLMKKLKATGVIYHRDLLLAIVRGQPSLCSTYLEEFPYNLEDFLSPTWLSLVSLTSKLVSSVTNGLSFRSLDSQSDDIPPLDDAYMKSIMKCLSSRVSSRSVINKGLLHSSILVKHGTLRLLLEALKLADSFLGALNQASSVNKQTISYWLSLKQEIQNEVQTLLPDPQVLLTLLSALGSQSRVHSASLKRASGLGHSFHGVKKLKTTVKAYDTDIIVSGVVSAPDIGKEVVEILTLETSEKEREFMNSIAELWDLNPFSIPLVKVDDVEMYFLSKLLDALKIYRRTMPNVLEGSFEFFINLLGNPSSLPTILQRSLLSLLIEYIASSSASEIHLRTPPGMYRHLQPFISLFLFSLDSDIKDKAYYLAQAAILSTGALDQNVYEVGSWFLFLPNYDRGISSVELGMESSENLVHVVVSFLCDAISTVGNNLFKYWGLVKTYINNLKHGKDVSPNFSPIIICVLQKCLRLLSAESLTFTIPEKSIISVYVSNTLKYLLQTQVDAGLLASVIESILSERFVNHGFLDVKSGTLNCVWRPLKNLLFFSRRISTAHCGDVLVDHCHLMNDEEIICNIDFDAIEASTGFYSFLERAPFHVLFPAIMCTHGASSLVLSKIQDLLLLKLNELTIDHLLFPYLRLVLFWAYQIQSYYRIKPIVELHQHSQICFTLLQNVLDKLLTLRTRSSTAGDYKVPLLRLEVQEVAETVFSHPAVVASLSCPLNCQEDVINAAIDESLESLIQLSGQKVNTLDRQIVNLLTTFCEYLLSLCDGRDPISKDVAKTFNVLIYRLFCEFRNRFDLYVDTEDLMPLLPPFFALHALHYFISPFDLLELVTWIFNRVNINDLMVQKSRVTHGLSIGFCIAVVALKDLTSYLQLSFPGRLPCNLFWKMNDEKNVYSIIEEISTKINVSATHYKSEFADACLLEVVKAICAKKSMLCGYFNQISLAMFRLVMIIPSELVSYCIHRTNKAKAKLLFILTETSSLHLSIFGYLIMEILHKHSCYMGMEMEDTSVFPFSEEEFFMLLPAALSYLNSVVIKFGKQFWHHFKIIPSVYSRILFQGFLQWKSFVSKSIFHEEYGELVPSSSQELITLFKDSLLGKATNMLRYHFALSGDLVSVKMRLKVFNSIFPASCANDEVLEFELHELDSYSPNNVLNFLNKVVAKISFGRVLLFPKGYSMNSLPKDNEKSTKVSLVRKSNKEESSRLQFLNILASIWQWIVKKFSCISDDDDGKETDNSTLFRYLEFFILKSILELSMEIHDALVKLQSIPFLEQLMRFSLLYRFNDPTTLNILYRILNLFSDGKFVPDLYLQLLVAHSQFAPTIQSAAKPSYSIGTVLRPMSSILRSLVIPSTDQWGTKCKQDSKTTQIYLKRLAIVKLLRMLVQLKVRQGGIHSGKDGSINFRELHSLLLSAYGATINETDSAILKVLHDIETIDGSDAQNLVNMDFLWGSATLRIKKERLLEHDSFSNISNDAEVLKEHHRNQFRENLPVDPKICVATVLDFPHDRIEFDEPLHLNKLQLKNLDERFEGHLHGIKPTEQYDPVYILQFAIHAVSMGYIEAMEFSSLGLLAIAFVSLSSANDTLRKLGYETLGALKGALEKCKRRKGIMRLRLLLTYVQNGIEEPWQRIPSIIALFAAEASFILLEPSNDHYAALSKFLMHSSRMNKKSIPLFQNFLWSSSVNFKSERLWILRLVYAGINVDDDARLYIKSTIHEDLQSFYVSPISDNESKELILKVMKKSVKSQRMAYYLVEHNGLFSWLSSIISTSGGRLTGDERSFFSKQLILALEVVNNVISFRNIIEWLQKHALEQLMEFSSHLFKILVGGEQLLIEGELVNPILQIVISTLKISQKRKIYQPHYTLSIEGLFYVYQAVHKLDCAGFGTNSDSGLKVVLMSMPPTELLRMDLKKCSNFLTWAIFTALESDSTTISKKSHFGFSSESEEEHCDESLTSKLLRWLSASVILGKIKLDSLNLATSERSNIETLYSLLERIKNTCDGSSLHVFGCEELLAEKIFYLQQHLKSSFMVLPVVISALCLLLFDAFISAGLFHNHGANIAQLLSKIHCPEEVNPAWRWTFYQAWKDYSLELTDLQKMDELHACQTLQVVISNILSKRPLDFQVLLSQDIEMFGVFEWERSLIMTRKISNLNS